jgi:threonine/homoserine/homoserine lactone efflux protein
MRSPALVRDPLRLRAVNIVSGLLIIGFGVQSLVSLAFPAS